MGNARPPSRPSRAGHTSGRSKPQKSAALAWTWKEKRLRVDGLPTVGARPGFAEYDQRGERIAWSATARAGALTKADATAAELLPLLQRTRRRVARQPDLLDDVAEILGDVGDAVVSGLQFAGRHPELARLVVNVIRG